MNKRNDPMENHPNKLSMEDNQFILDLRKKVSTRSLTEATPISRSDFDRAMEILERWPSWEIDDKGRFIYDKPITITQVYSSQEYHDNGIENFKLGGKVIIVEV